MSVLMYGSEAMIMMKKDRYKFRAVEIKSLRGVLGSGRMDKVTNLRIRQSCGVTKGVDEKIDELFGHVERMMNDRIAKRV